jgi:hypothetical protein
MFFFLREVNGSEVEREEERTKCLTRLNEGALDG